MIAGEWCPTLTVYGIYQTAETLMSESVGCMYMHSKHVISLLKKKSFRLLKLQNGIYIAQICAFCIFLQNFFLRQLY